jgi:hypothetical protein
MTPEIEKDPRPTGDPALASASGSTYVELVKSQAYIIQHQQDLLNNCVRRNADLVKVCNQVERENQTLRKKLKGHEDGKLWTLLWAILPTRDMIEPK